ncbi:MULTISPECIES: hypothetical protein [unclassified Shewanella]|uniref:hypothetical protein n=1 Tax=unclassified Shewanella TaxID=196818 RepID=UPI000C8555CD|nr:MULTISPECIES: hypothetical protein [unclassified Shewanella]MDO6678437.1 hypothetical protein [Shewanella sp. 4_MG-2023]PMH96257.1 hypothetical protein BCU55_02790 [Shewanella sp. 10N.286.48.A6]
MDYQVESFYANITLNDVQLAAVYYPILIDLARHKHCLTYGELVQRAKDLHPEKEYVQRAIPVSAGRKLDVVRIFTSERNLPDATSLIINKTAGECGSGMTDNFDPKQLREDVFNYDWSNVSNEFDLYIETAEKNSTPPVKIKRVDAMKMTLDYYKAHQAALPKAISSHRDDIIALILEGYDTERAFKMVSENL